MSGYAIYWLGWFVGFGFGFYAAVVLGYRRKKDD